MKIAAAQINCTVGMIQQNLNEHYRIIEMAIDEGIQLITFPEMSITGYCREEGKNLAFTVNDDRLHRLQKLSNIGAIIIVVGAPIRIEKDLFIGSFIIYPDRPIEIYTKQYLHDGEELFYKSSMEYNPIINLGSDKIGLAICADINNENHPHKVKQKEGTIYLPSIFYSRDGLEEGYKRLEDYAKKYNLNILMSNYSGNVWNMESGGSSAFWDSGGVLIDHMNINSSGILIIEWDYNKWHTQKIEMSN